MLLVSPKYGCSEEILSIVSLLSVPMVFQRPPDSKKAADAAKAQFQDRHSDHCTLLTAYNAWVESGRKYLSEGAAREWSTVVIVIIIFIS